ncbi:MAG TPA: M50 family metallopeptidase [Candidatus Pacearchaeota archaeon]|nr:M50 family metallopeptidase [Candidatus Pacearchaeota archaeon]HOK94257.1 M50 family metallopeptidase [Candidatus Pacearchaeota archaeon]HPO75371.1 M50 family metallopeptidase [Candidatus Pacearchaeota archaeon]
MLFLTIIVFILILGLLIFAHEFCHFISAKRNGIRVEEFGIGIPPRIFGIYKENGKLHFFWGNKKVKTESTIYSLNWIPFGGFNNIYGMDSRIKEAGSFWTKSIGTRAKVIFAGVFGNFILASLLFSIVFASGAPQAIEGEPPVGAFDIGVQIVQIAQNSPAEKSGLKIGDKIVQITTKNSQNQDIIQVENPEDIQNFTSKHLGEDLILTIKRGNQVFDVEVATRINPPKGEGAMGIALTKIGRIAYPWYEAILKSFEYSFWLIGATITAFFQAIQGVIVGQTVPGIEIAGPIGVGGLVSQMIDLGPIYVVQFTAILSINLFILNLIPFPALDGGWLLFLLLEKIRKKPVKLETEALINQIGFTLLILLMIIVTFQDLQKLFLK